MRCRWSGPEDMAKTKNGHYPLCPECWELGLAEIVLDLKYTPEIDRLLWAYPWTEDWTSEQWVELAKAALDQAGWTPEAIKQVCAAKAAF